MPLDLTFLPGPCPATVHVVGISINDLRGGQSGDATLQNLLDVLGAKLELCSRLPICAYEADNEGHEQCATAFRRLAEVERRSFDDLLGTLHRHLDAASSTPDADAPTSSRPGVPDGGRV